MITACLILLATSQAPVRAATPFRIHVVDAATGRGIPLVELETVHHVRLWTDNLGNVAFAEPDLLGRRVFFHVRSPGYRFREDGFGFAGVALQTRPGGEARLELERVQPAERLYRITGAGRLVHSRRLGLAPPLAADGPPGGVLGQDSVQATPWQGGLFWLWGDTSRARYPLGNFHASGARSPLPGPETFDPEEGILLDYFTGEDGFCRPLCPVPGPGPVWLDALCTLPDAQGRSTLVCRYMRVRDLGTILEQGLAEWDPAAARFRPVRQVPVDAPLTPLGHPLQVRLGDARWLLCAHPFPLVRLPATREAFLDPARWEAFSCLEPGSAWEPEARVERDATGTAVWGWKPGTAWVDPRREETLVRRGVLAREERVWAIQDPAGGREVLLHAGSLHWNAWRRRWIVLAVEQGGTDSFLGEVWYVEAPTPMGPWENPRKVATHPGYSFYNPFQHPWFDREGGRVIFFEGTLAATFSRAAAPIPRYDYNQLLYRLDLGDPRLHLSPPAAGEEPAAEARPAVVPSRQRPTPVPWQEW